MHRIHRRVCQLRLSSSLYQMKWARGTCASYHVELMLYFVVVALSNGNKQDSFGTIEGQRLKTEHLTQTRDTVSACQFQH